MTSTELDDLLAACRAYRGGETGEDFRQASGAFERRAAKDGTILRQAAAALPSLPPAGSARLAVLLGAAVERGAAAEETVPDVLKLFRSWLAQLPSPDESDKRPDPTPEQAGIIKALPQLCQSVVWHLARLPKLREELWQDNALRGRLELLEAYYRGAIWQALRCSSGMLIVLHQPSGTGFRMRCQNVATGFHLFSLLQIAVGARIPGGKRPDPAVEAAATGQSQAQLSDAAWWYYGDPRAQKPSLMTTMWGEPLVRQFPAIDGEHVILLWPPILSHRGWDSNFFGPHLMEMPAEVTIEARLTTQECRPWFARLGIEVQRPQPPWWKLW